MFFRWCSADEWNAVWGVSTSYCQQQRHIAIIHTETREKSEEMIIAVLCSVTIQMKATEQYFPVGAYTMLYKVVLTFESVDGILKCGHSNGSH